MTDNFNLTHAFPWIRSITILPVLLNILDPLVANNHDLCDVQHIKQ